MIRLFLFALVIWLATPSTAQVVYLTPDGTGSGSSWAESTNNLAGVLDTASMGLEIWVASGTFRPTECSPCTPNDEMRSFQIPPGVKLLGGFAGTEAAITDRVSSTAPSILSGEIEPGVDSMGSRSVLVAQNSTAGTVIDGFTFEHGRALNERVSLSDASASGALLFVGATNEEHEIELEIKNCAFRDGRSRGFGGALYVEAGDGRSSKLLMSDCTFETCTAGEAGGAVAINSGQGGSDASRISACSFRQNTAITDGGGAVFLSSIDDGSSAASFEHVVFEENRAGRNGGAVYLDARTGNGSASFDDFTFRQNHAEFGGGLYIGAGYGGSNSPSLTNGAFLSNDSDNAGGGAYAFCAFGGTSNPAFDRVEFVENQTEESGGGILINAIEGSSKATYRDCRFEGNAATLYGGAIYNLGREGICDPTLINCTISNNSAASAGGMYCLGSVGGQSNALIINSAFVGNQAQVGGGLYANANDTTGTANPLVVNTVFYDNMASFGATFRLIHAQPRVVNSAFDISSCEDLNSGIRGNPICVEANLFGIDDPFQNRAGGDYTPVDNSVLIDAGTDTSLVDREIFTDLSGEARLRGQAVDIGPVERTDAPIIWREILLPNTVERCAGETLQLTAGYYPAYPAAYRWTRDGEVLAETASLPARQPNASGTYIIHAEAFGESVTDTVEVVINPVVMPSLSILGAAAEVCVDSQLQLIAVIDDLQAAEAHLEWTAKSEANTETSTADILLLTPATIGNLEVELVASYSGLCLVNTEDTVKTSFSVLACESSGTREVIDAEVRLYPNPTTDRVVIEGSQGSDYHIFIIYNSAGVEQFSGTVSDLPISVSLKDLPPGLFTVILYGDESAARALLVKH